MRKSVALILLASTLMGFGFEKEEYPTPCDNILDTVERNNCRSNYFRAPVYENDSWFVNAYQLLTNPNYNAIDGRNYTDKGCYAYSSITKNIDRNLDYYKWAYGRSFFEQFTTPLLIIGAVLYFVFRRRRRI